MQWICSTFGSSGDVFPLLGLAVALRQRGHEVIFATNDYFREQVERSGVRFESLGDRQTYLEAIRHPDLWHPRRSFAHIFRWIEPVLRQQYALHQRCAAQGSVLGLTNCFGFGARIAQDHLGIPVVTVHLQPGVIWSAERPPKVGGLFGPRWLQNLLYRLGERWVVDPIACPRINRWRGELGLPPIRQLTRWWHSPFGVLCLFPEWYAPPASDWPTPLIQTDFPLWNDRSDEGLPDEVTVFLSAGDAPLVFTPGSANVQARGFFQAAVQACQLLGRRGILLTEFPEQIPNVLPASVRHFSYVPLDQLLPHSAALIHHGGIGSTSQALAAGVPQVVMTLAHDQFDNAARLMHWGVGEALTPSRFTGQRLARCLKTLLDSAPVRTSCRAIAGRITACEGIHQAVVALEAMAKPLDSVG